jgi:hypothetical protein
MKKTSKMKLKQINIQIQIRELIDLTNVFHQLKQQINDGNEFGEFHHETSSVHFTMEFLEQSNFIEKQIDGVWFQCFEMKPDPEIKNEF